LRAVLSEKFRQRHAGLHLNRVYRHDRGLHMSVWLAASLARVATAATWAELQNESGPSMIEGKLSANRIGS
jgi:hypothetical protein